jgi:hypothetical protein
MFNTTLLMGDTLKINKWGEPYLPPVRHASPYGGSYLYVQTNASQFCMEKTNVVNASGGVVPGMEGKYLRTLTGPGRYLLLRTLLPLPCLLLIPPSLMKECPKWAGGDGKAVTSDSKLNQDWILLNFTADSAGTGITVDLKPLNGSVPTAVRYAWGIVQCCNHADPTLYVSHGCIANCPIYSAKADLPATPFQAKIVDGKCECVAPQVCSCVY